MMDVVVVFSCLSGILWVRFTRPRSDGRLFGVV
jgi:hypothetical protein